MTWNAVFPTGGTLISQSVTQIQNNWAFIATNISTDHYFNSGAPNEGHHKFVQLVNQGGDAAAAVNGVFYSKVNGAGNTQPWFNNGNIIAQVPVIFTTSVTFGAPGTSFVNFLTANAGGAMPAFSGTAQIIQQGGAANFATVSLSYSAGSVTVGSNPQQAGAQISAITGGANRLQWTSSVAGTYNVIFLMYQ